MFVGREREMAELERLLDETVEGQGRLAMLVGEPGIGKTRTARELSATARERGARVLWGRSHEALGGPPYWLWVQVLRSYVQESDPESLREDMGTGAADIAEIVPEIRERLPDLLAVQGIEDPEQARFRLFDSITRFLKRASERKPMMLVLDNLHSVGKPSLLFLQFLAEELEGAALFVVGTYRDTELTRKHPLSDTLAVLHRESLMVRVLLRGLTLPEVSEFTSSMADAVPSSQLVDAIHRQTEGNPFFVTEVVRFLAERGDLSGTSSLRSRERGIGGIRIPEGVREAIGHRLNRLSEASNHVLGVASVAGREFHVEELQPLLNNVRRLDDEGLLAALEECLACGMLEEVSDSPGRYQFRHALVRETLYDELPAPRRIRLHGQMGEVLEELYQDRLEPHFARLAHHFFAAAPVRGSDKVLHYATRAGERAMKLLAFEEASEFFRMALDAVELRNDEDHRARCRLLFELGQAQYKAGEFHQAIGSLEDSASMAKRLGSADQLAEAALALEDLSRRFNVAIGGTISTLEEALAILPAEDSSLRAALVGATARAFCIVGNYERYHTLSRDAVDMARRLGDPRALMSALRVSIFARQNPEEIPKRLAATLEMTKLARELGELEHELESQGHRAMDLIELGKMSLADEAIAEHTRLCEVVRQPFYDYAEASFHGMRATMNGDFELAERRIRQAYVKGQRLGRGSFDGAYGIQMFTLRRLQGRLGDVVTAVKNFAAERGVSSSWRPGLAAIYAELGMVDEARQLLDELAVDDFAAIPNDALWLISITYLAEVVAGLRDTSRAEILYERALRYAGLNVGGQVVCYGAASRYLGLLAGTLSRWEDAEKHFVDALAANNAMHALPWVALTEYDYAVLLLERGRKDDESRARSLLESASATASKLGMAALDERVAGRLESPPLADDVPEVTRDQLTPREIDVLRLVAYGRSNREISEALYISLNTVATHVRHILAKSGSANRTEAAAYAIQHGLA